MSQALAKPRVAISDYVTEPDIEAEVLDGVAELVCLGAKGTGQLFGRVADVDVIICFHEVQITAEVLEQARRCRCVIRGGVGYDNIDAAQAAQRGIVVCNVPDYGTEEVADHTLALLLGLARNIVPAVESVRRGQWVCPANPHSPRLRGRTLGIVGCGRIGTAVAERAKAFGLRVVFYDPYVPRGYEKAIGVERAGSLEQLLPQCQFLSLHCTLTDETRHMLDGSKLALLPAGSYLVNTARGGLLDEAGLLQALDEGPLAAAALDVLEREPLDDDRLRTHPRLLITPHSAFFSLEAGPELRRKAAEEARRVASGQPPLNPVNRDLISSPRTPLQ